MAINIYRKDNTRDNTRDNTKDNTKELINEINKKKDRNINFKYICIKKEYFDVNMIYLDYTNLRKTKYIEIIYKSPSVFLDGLFFKTPELNYKLFTIIQKKYSNPDRNNNSNNIIIKLSLNNNEHRQFINMLFQIDEYIYNYIHRYAKDINKELNNNNPNNSSDNNTNNNNNYNIYTHPVEMYRYDNIIRKRGNNYDVNMKSYLDNKTIWNLQKLLNNSESSFLQNTTDCTLENPNLSANENDSIISSVSNESDIMESSIETPIETHTETPIDTNNIKYVLTFNISNIYIGQYNLLPLIKCNKCEIIN